MIETQTSSSGKHRMDGDSVQPGREPAALFEAGQGAPRGNKGVLGAVLSCLALAGEAQAKAVDSGCELPVEVFERPLIPAGSSGYERGGFSGGIHRSGPLQHLNRPHRCPLRSSSNPLEDSGGGKV